MATKPRIANLDQLVKEVMNRHQMLKPVDVQDKVNMFQYVFTPDQNAQMIRLTEEGNGQGLIMHRRAEVQLLERLGIPVRFFDRCPEKLKWMTANHFAQNGGYDKEVTIRTIKDNEARAIVSDQYTAIDDVDIMPMVSDVVSDLGGDVKIADFHPDYTHVRIVFPGTETETRPGDIIQTGIHLTNSEVGLRAVHLDAMVYRLICTNGMVRGESNGRTSIRHVGDRDRLKDYIRRSIEDAKVNSAEMVKKFKASVEMKLNEPEKFIEGFAAQQKLTQSQFKDILNTFNYYEDKTMYGVINAVTETAQKSETVEGRYQLERIGTSLLDRVAA